MKGSAGILLVAVGLVALYIVLSGKYQCVTGMIDCLSGADMKTPEGFTRGDAQPQPQTPNTPKPLQDQPVWRNIFNPDGSIRVPWNDQRPWFQK